MFFACFPFSLLVLFCFGMASVFSSRVSFQSTTWFANSCISFNTSDLSTFVFPSFDVVAVCPFMCRCCVLLLLCYLLSALLLLLSVILLRVAAVLLLLVVLLFLLAVRYLWLESLFWVVWFSFLVDSISRRSSWFLFLKAATQSPLLSTPSGPHLSGYFFLYF